jgi:hypothetical protein
MPWRKYKKRPPGNAPPEAHEALEMAREECHEREAQWDANNKSAGPKNDCRIKMTSPLNISVRGGVDADG